MRPVLEKAGKKLVPQMDFDSPYHIDQDIIKLKRPRLKVGMTQLIDQ